VLSYLKAVKAAGTKDTEAVAAKLKELPFDDLLRAKAARYLPQRPAWCTISICSRSRAVGIEEAVGLLQAACRGARRQGVSGREGFRLPAGEVMTAIV